MKSILAVSIAAALLSHCKNPTRGSDGKKLSDSKAGLGLVADKESWFCSAECVSKGEERQPLESFMEQHASPEMAFAKILQSCNEIDGQLAQKRSPTAAFSAALIGDVCEKVGDKQAQICAGICQSTFRGGSNSYRFIRSQSFTKGQKKLQNTCSQTESVLLKESFSCLAATGVNWICSYPCKSSNGEDWERLLLRSSKSLEAAFGQLTADCALEGGELNLKGMSPSNPYRVDSLCVAENAAQATK